MVTIRIDDKFSIQYDPEENNRATAILRYGEPHITFTSPAILQGWMYVLLAQYIELATCVEDFVIADSMGWEDMREINLKKLGEFVHMLVQN